MNKIKLVYMWFEWKTSFIFRDFMKQRYLDALNVNEKSA